MIFLSESSPPAPRVEPTRSLSRLIVDNPVLPHSDTSGLTSSTNFDSGHQVES